MSKNDHEVVLEAKLDRCLEAVRLANRDLSALCAEMLVRCQSSDPGGLALDPGLYEKLAELTVRASKIRSSADAAASGGIAIAMLSLGPVRSPAWFRSARDATKAGIEHAGEDCSCPRCKAMRAEVLEAAKQIAADAAKGA